MQAAIGPQLENIDEHISEENRKTLLKTFIRYYVIELPLLLQITLKIFIGFLV